MDCNTVPEDKAKNAIARTQEAGLVHGFLKFPDGTTSDVIEGGEASIDFDNSHDEITSIFYTRPDNAPIISRSNRELLYSGALDALCVGIQVNGEHYTFCERSNPSCTRTLEASDERAELSEVSTCVDYQQAPSWSSSHGSVDQPLTFDIESSSQDDVQDSRPIEIVGIGFRTPSVGCPFE